MKTRTGAPRIFDFRFPACHTLIRVEDREDVVVIRATRDTFSRLARERFIHWLAAEGFIPDEFHGFAFDRAALFRPLCWLIDYSWVMLDSADEERARRFMVRLLLSSGALWLILLVSLAWRAGG